LFDASGTARDGKAYDNTYSWFLRLQDGRIVEAIAFFDTIEFTDFWHRITPQAERRGSNPRPGRTRSDAEIGSSEGERLPKA
jgi:hypothetical protein